MPRILTRQLAVPAEAIDVNGHVNNLAYLRWMQDIATEHSAAQGWPLARYLESGFGWVVRSHFIEYLLPAFEADALSILTWVADVRGRSSRRRYLFYRAADHSVVARAETLWVCVDARSGKAISIPEALRSAFEVVPENEDVLRTAGLSPAGTS